MARPKDQTARREQLIRAAMTTIADRGLTGTTIKGIAETAGISQRLVAYYYPDLENLIEAVHQVATERYYWTRHATVNDDATPAIKLARLIRSGLPTPEEMLISQVLNEVSVDARRSPMHATLMTLLFDREVSLYVGVLSEGRADGTFDLRESVTTIARNFVVLEDGLGLHLLGDNSSLTFESAHEQILSYARAATGVDSLPAVTDGIDHSS